MRQAARHLAQQFVAAPMPEHLVHLAETVDVDDDEAEWQVPSLGERHETPRLVVEHQLVRQFGQGIEMREIRLLAAVAEQAADIAGNTANADRPAMLVEDRKGADMQPAEAAIRANNANLLFQAAEAMHLQGLFETPSVFRMDEVEPVVAIGIQRLDITPPDLLVALADVSHLLADRIEQPVAFRRIAGQLQEARLPGQFDRLQFIAVACHGYCKNRATSIPSFSAAS